MTFWKKYGLAGLITGLILILLGLLLTWATVFVIGLGLSIAGLIIVIIEIIAPLK